MKVFKFGGASVKDAEGVRNVAQILRLHQDGPVLAVVSAMGKTTNALEKLTSAYFSGDPASKEIFSDICTYHFDVLLALFPTPNWVYQEVKKVLDELEKRLLLRPSSNFDFEYDQIVSTGEILSSLIVSGYLKNNGFTAEWVDARQIIATDRTFREGRVIWDTTLENVNRTVVPLLNEKTVLVTQGFIGYTPENQVTTLGREGSDYSAAIFSWCLNVESVTIWKDVPGVLNADPKRFDQTVFLPRISFKEALELSYYGATVIHPKTIKPLQNKNIRLFVRSFLNPSAPGTEVQNDTSEDHLVPSIIVKDNQVLLSISPKDFSFMVEENLRDIFDLFFRFNVKINMMQNSALDFSVVVDTSSRVFDLITELKKGYRVLYNENQELLTIRHYDQETLRKVLNGKKIFLEQRTRQTIRMVVNNRS